MRKGMEGRKGMIGGKKEKERKRRKKKEKDTLELG